MKRTARAIEPDPYSFGSRPYDLVKEFVIALTAVAVLTIVLAAVFSSPDVKPMTIASWSQSDPADFTATALAELDGSSATAGYGPPYNTASVGQKLGPLALAQAAGVTHPIDTAQDFVLGPLESAPQNPPVKAALSGYQAADANQQAAWTSAYSDALTKANGDPTKVAPGAPYGPVPVLLGQLLAQARAGSLDGQLLAEGGFYDNDYTLPLLFLADGSDLAAEAQTQNLAGNQWGMMNEIGNFPGQIWLAPNTFFYQISPFNTSANADALVWGVVGLLGAVLVLMPFIPGVRSIPRLVPVYRLIWREHYRQNPERQT